MLYTIHTYRIGVFYSSCRSTPVENHSTHELGALPHGVSRTTGQTSGLNIPLPGLILVLRERAMPVFVRLPQFAAALEAATIQLLDKSLLRAARTKAGSPSPAEPQEEDEGNALHPQLMMVGPVGVAIASTRYVRVYEHVPLWSNGDGPGVGAPHDAHTTPTPPAPGSQVRRLMRLGLLLIVCAEMGFLVEICRTVSTTICAVFSRCFVSKEAFKERNMYVNACSAQQ